MQSSSCILVLAARLDAAENTIALVNVTTAPESPNVDLKGLQVFSLTVAVGGRAPSATENSLENGTKLETWHIVLIFLSSSVFLLVLILIILLLVHKRKHGSYFSKNLLKVTQIQDMPAVSYDLKISKSSFIIILRDTYLGPCGHISLAFIFIRILNS